MLGYVCGDCMSFFLFPLYIYISLSLPSFFPPPFFFFLFSFFLFSQFMCPCLFMHMRMLSCVVGAYHRSPCSSSVGLVESRAVLLEAYPTS